MTTHAGRMTHDLPGRDRSTSPVVHPSPKVLLIEGHADTRELYELWLTQRQFSVTATATGSAALAAARAEAPDVVVIELMVPEGGVSLIGALRAEAACRDAIVIVMTTQTGVAIRQRALEAGADFYLVKPCGVMRLGEVMAVASDHRSRLVAPDAYGLEPPTARLRLAVLRSGAICERLAAEVPSALPAGGVH